MHLMPAIERFELSSVVVVVVEVLAVKAILSDYV